MQEGKRGESPMHVCMVIEGEERGGRLLVQFWGTNLLKEVAIPPLYGEGKR